MKILRTVARPCIYRLSLENILFTTAHPTTDRDRLEKWGWVDIWELLECIVELPGAPELSKKRDFAHPLSLLNHFAALNGAHRCEAPSVTCINHSKAWIDSQGFPSAEQFGREFYVPAGWANNVIDLVEKGVERVWLESVHGIDWDRFAALNGMREPMVKTSGGWRIRDGKK